MDTTCGLCKKHITIPLWGLSYYRCKKCYYSICIQCDMRSPLRWITMDGKKCLLCLKCREKTNTEEQNGTTNATISTGTPTATDETYDFEKFY